MYGFEKKSFEESVIILLKDFSWNVFPLLVNFVAKRINTID